MLWGCLAVSDTICARHNEIKIMEVFWINHADMLHSVRELLQWGNNPKHMSKSSQAWMRRKFWALLERPAMNPDLKPSECLYIITAGRSQSSNLSYYCNCSSRRMGQC